MEINNFNNEPLTNGKNSHATGKLMYEQRKIHGKNAAAIGEISNYNIEVTS